MSTPTDTDEKTEMLVHVCGGKIYTRREFCPRHGGFHICRGVMYDSKKDCPRCKDGRNETPWHSLWWWTTFELPKSPLQRTDFFGIILMILAAEIAIGFFIGTILRSIFGWPF